MQPVRFLLVWLGGAVALASLLAVVHGTKVDVRQSSRPSRVLWPLHRNRLAAYYRISLN